MSGIGFEVLVTHCIEEIGRERWDALSGTQPFASYAWYRFGERAMASSRPLYICLSRHGEPLARASFWLMRDEPLPLANGPLRQMLHAFLRVKPLLICRSPIAEATGLILPEPPLRKEALDTILSMARAYGRKLHASFVVFDYLHPQQAGMADWPGGLSPMTLEEPGTCLPITWDSYEQYLNGLTKTAWKDYRRQRNQAERLGIEIRAGQTVDAMEQALPLIHGEALRHGSSPKPWARPTLENAAMASATWLTAWMGDRLAGCGLLLADNGVQLTTLLGLDPGAPYVYFQLMYCAIRQAIEQGARVLRAGSGAYELKQRLGFQIDANNHLRFAGQGQILSWAGRLAGE